MSTIIAFWLHFRVLGGLVGGCRGYLEASWREVGLSWASLASSWNLMTAWWRKDGEDERRDANLEGTWVAKSDEGWFGGNGGELGGAGGNLPGAK